MSAAGKHATSMCNAVTAEGKRCARAGVGQQGCFQHPNAGCTPIRSTPKLELVSSVLGKRPIKAAPVPSAKRTVPDSDCTPEYRFMRVHDRIDRMHASRSKFRRGCYDIHDQISVRVKRHARRLWRLEDTNKKLRDQLDGAMEEIADMRVMMAIQSATPPATPVPLPAPEEPLPMPVPVPTTTTTITPTTTTTPTPTTTTTPTPENYEKLQKQCAALQQSMERMEAAMQTCMTLGASTFQRVATLEGEAMRRTVVPALYVNIPGSQ